MKPDLVRKPGEVGSHPSRQTASEEQSTDHHHDKDAGDESECTPL